VQEDLPFRKISFPSLKTNQFCFSFASFFCFFPEFSPEFPLEFLQISSSVSLGTSGNPLSPYEFSCFLSGADFFEYAISEN
jgi:hypothetical protein